VRYLSGAPLSHLLITVVKSLIKLGPDCSDMTTDEFDNNNLAFVNYDCTMFYDIISPGLNMRKGPQVLGIMTVPHTDSKQW
jgi:hypothetical protein